jgi:Ca2+-transporting ATPase
MMQQVESRKTPLQEKMDVLGKHLSLISFLVIGIIALIGILQGRPMLDMLTISGN